MKSAFRESVTTEGISLEIQVDRRIGKFYKPESQLSSLPASPGGLMLITNAGLEFGKSPFNLFII